MNEAPPAELAAWGSPAARRVLATCVLGSSMAFLDATVVNVALPQIGVDLGTGLSGLQWVVNAYLVALSSLVLVGGALGDRFGRRRVYLIGVAGFAVASLLAAASPSIGVLLVARGAQGVAAALVVPGSLALLTAAIHPEDRARAVGAWSGLTAVAGAVGPLLGGWLVDALSWRWVFLINLPVALAVAIVARRLPAEPVTDAPPGIDIAGGVLAALGLGLATAGAIGHGSVGSRAALVTGIVVLIVFVVHERRAAHPMLPLRLFSSAQFSGANAVTLAVYAGLGVATFLVVLQLQLGLGYSALQAGAALLPITLMLLVLSSPMGALAQRIGPTGPMTVGPLVAGLGLLALSTVEPGDAYVPKVLVAVSVLGLGLAVTVAPLTAVVMASVDELHLGVASGVNNAVARMASLLGVAVVPTLAGVDLTAEAGSGLPGYRTALMTAAGLCAVGAAIAALTIRRGRAVRPTVQAALLEPCRDPCLADLPAA